jgi:hypothetical protein
VNVIRFKFDSSIAISQHQEEILPFSKNDAFKLLPPKNPGIKRAGEADIKPSDCCRVPMLMADRLERSLLARRTRIQTFARHLESTRPMNPLDPLHAHLHPVGYRYP